LKIDGYLQGLNAFAVFYILSAYSVLSAGTDCDHYDFFWDKLASKCKINMLSGFLILKNLYFDFWLLFVIYIHRNGQ